MSRRPAVLFLAHLLPWPLVGGGQMKSFHTLEALAARYDIRLLSFVRSEEEARTLGPLPDLCRRGVRTVPRPRGRLHNLRALLRAERTGGSFVVGRDDSPAFRAAVVEELSRAEYAAIHADHLPMAAYLPVAGVAPPRRVLDQHNAEHVLWRRLAESPLTPPPVRLLAHREWPRLRAAEAALCQSADRVLAVSEEDARALRGLMGSESSAHVSVVPIAVDTEHFAPGHDRLAPAPDALVSFGTLYWPPNVAGLEWFCREVLPRVRSHRPGAKLTLAGAGPNRAARRLAALPGVTLEADVPDIRPLAARSRVLVVPLFAGSGVRVKLLCALAMGLPVVSTPLGAEGLEGARDGEHLLLAETAEAFADAVTRVLSDDALAARLAQNGRALVERSYARGPVADRLLAAYEQTLAGEGVPR
jgi:Glycosyltransferase